jgi:hypothetical protein
MSKNEMEQIMYEMQRRGWELIDVSNRYLRGEMNQTEFRALEQHLLLDYGMATLELARRRYTDILRRSLIQLVTYYHFIRGKP